ncbi:MAG: hypothetical protein HWN65_21970 [Candidatus Helarchaeota archaeon]|nr:hypothetical protein [Candidatus Helarchaeota archaeon]
MPRNLIDLSKILPISLERVKKYIKCTHLWKAMSPIPEKDMKFEFIDENTVHQDVKYTFTIGLTGLIKHTAHIVQEVKFEEIEDNNYSLTIEKSNEVAKSDLRITLEDMDDKVNVKVALVQLYFKSGVLELVGKRVVVNRFRAEIRKLLKRVAQKLRDGSLEPVFAKCDEELEKAEAE